MTAVSAMVTYGYTILVGLLFVAGVGFLRRNRSYPTVLFALAMGVALLSQVGQILAFHIYPIVWDKAGGILPNASRKKTVEILLLTSTLGALVGALSLVAFAYRRVS